MDTDGAGAYVLGDKVSHDAGVANAGSYDFQIGLQLLEDGTYDVRMQIKKGSDYIWEAHAIDNTSPLPATKFNSVCFAINNSAITAIHLEAVEVTKTEQPIVLDIATEPTSGLPTVYSLSQNYPNPFNPSTTIKFGLPQNSKVKLVVYNVLGQIVAKVAEKDMNAGYHTVTFNASKFSTGVYFYRLEAGDFVQVKKMMLLK